MRNLVEKCEDMKQQIIEWRRHLHQYPEIGFDLPETEAFIAHNLRAMGVEVREGVAEHGVVGLINGKGPGPTFAIRSDMDALKVVEETGLPFASKHHGRMHACGHDGHMAIVLASTKVLAENRDSFAGNVKVIFQPAEEGLGGAKRVIADGGLKNPAVEAIIGLHDGTLWDLPNGHVGVMSTPMMASMDPFKITIKGKGTHGAFPDQGTDVIYIGSLVMSTLQALVSRRVSALESIVISIGSFHAGTSPHIMPEEAVLEGGIRCLSEDVRRKIPIYIEEIVRGACNGMGGDFTIEHEWGYPVLENNPEFTAFFTEVAKDVIGEERVDILNKPTMGAEDMAFYLKEVPGTFFFLSSPKAMPDGKVYPHHNARFDIDEDVLWFGTALFVETARRWLEKQTASNR